MHVSSTHGSSPRTRLARLALFLFTAAFLAGCGGTQAPCTDDDPLGPCATSHSRTYG